MEQLPDLQALGVSKPAHLSDLLVEDLEEVILQRNIAQPLTLLTHVKMSCSSEFRFLARQNQIKQRHTHTHLLDGSS